MKDRWNIEKPSGNRVVAIVGEPSPTKKLINAMIQGDVKVERIEVGHDYSQMEYKVKEQFREHNDKVDSLRYAVTKIGDGEEVPSHSLTFTPNYKEEN